MDKVRKLNGDPAKSVHNAPFLTPVGTFYSEPEYLDEASQHELLLEAENYFSESVDCQDRVQLMLTKLCNVAGPRISRQVQARVHLLQARSAIVMADRQDSVADSQTRVGHFFIATGSCLRQALTIGRELGNLDICYNASVVLIQGMSKLPAECVKWTVPLLRQTLSALEKLQERDVEWLIELESNLTQALALSFLQLVKGKPAPPVKVESSAHGAQKAATGLFIDVWPPPQQDPFGDFAKEAQTEVARHCVHLLNLALDNCPWKMLEKCAMVRSLVEQHVNLQQRLSMEVNSHPNLTSYFQVVKFYEDGLPSLDLAGSSGKQVAALAKDILTQGDAFLAQIFSFILLLNGVPPSNAHISDMREQVVALSQGAMTPVVGQRMVILAQMLEVAMELPKSEADTSWDYCKRLVVKLDRIIAHVLHKASKVAGDLLDLATLLLHTLIGPLIDDSQWAGNRNNEIAPFLQRAAAALKLFNSRQYFLRLQLHVHAAVSFIHGDDNLNAGRAQLDSAKELASMFPIVKGASSTQANPSTIGLIHYYTSCILQLDQLLLVKFGIASGGLSPVQEALTFLEQASLLLPNDASCAALLSWVLKTLFPKFELGSSDKLDLASYKSHWQHWEQQQDDGKSDSLRLREFASVLYKGLLIAQRAALPALMWNYATFLVSIESSVFALGITYQTWIVHAKLCQFEALLLDASLILNLPQVISLAVETIGTVNALQFSEQSRSAHLRAFAVKTIWNLTLQNQSLLLSKEEHYLAWFEFYVSAFAALKEAELTDDLLFVQVSTALVRCIYHKLKEQNTGVKSIGKISTEQMGSLASNGTAGFVGKATGKGAASGLLGNQSSSDSAASNLEDANLIKLADEVVKVGLAAKDTHCTSKVGLVECRGLLVPFRTENLAQLFQAASLEQDPVIKIASIISLATNSKLGPRESILKALDMAALRKQEMPSELKARMILSLAKLALGCDMVSLSFELLQLADGVIDSDLLMSLEPSLYAGLERLKSITLTQMIEKKIFVKTRPELLRSACKSLLSHTSWILKGGAEVSADGSFVFPTLLFLVKVARSELLRQITRDGATGESLLLESIGYALLMTELLLQSNKASAAAYEGATTSLPRKLSLAESADANLVVFQQHKLLFTLILYFYHFLTDSAAQLPLQGQTLLKQVDKLAKMLPRTQRKVYNYGKLLWAAFYGFSFPELLFMDTAVYNQAALYFKYGKLCSVPEKAILAHGAALRLVQEAEQLQSGKAFEDPTSVKSVSTIRTLKCMIIVELALAFVNDYSCELPPDCDLSILLSEAESVSSQLFESALSGIGSRETSALSFQNFLLRLKVLHLRLLLETDITKVQDRLEQLYKCFGCFAFDLLQVYGLKSPLFVKILSHQYAATDLSILCAQPAPTIPAVGQQSASGTSGKGTRAQAAANTPASVQGSQLSKPTLQKALAHFSELEPFKSTKRYLHSVSLYDVPHWLCVLLHTAPLFEPPADTDSSASLTGASLAADGEESSGAPPVVNLSETQYTVDGSDLSDLLSILVTAERFLDPTAYSFKSLSVYALLEAVLPLLSVSGRVAHSESYAAFVTRMVQQKLLQAHKLVAPALITSGGVSETGGNSGECVEVSALEVVTQPHLSTKTPSLGDFHIDLPSVLKAYVPCWQNGSENLMATLGLPEDAIFHDMIQAWFSSEPEDQTQILAYLEKLLSTKLQVWSAPLVDKTRFFYRLLLCSKLDGNAKDQSYVSTLQDELKRSKHCHTLFSSWLAKVAQNCPEELLSTGFIDFVSTCLACRGGSSVFQNFDELSLKLLEAKLLERLKKQVQAKSSVDVFYSSDSLLELWIGHFSRFAVDEYLHTLSNKGVLALLKVLEVATEQLVGKRNSFLLRQHLLLEALQVLRVFKSVRARFLLNCRQQTKVASYEVFEFSIDNGVSLINFCITAVKIQSVATKVLLLLNNLQEPAAVANDLNYQIAKHLSLDPRLKERFQAYGELQTFGLTFILPVLVLQCFSSGGKLLSPYIQTLELLIARIVGERSCVRSLPDIVLRSFESFLEVAAWSVATDPSAGIVLIKRSKSLYLTLGRSTTEISGNSLHSKSSNLVSLPKSAKTSTDQLSKRSQASLNLTSSTSASAGLNGGLRAPNDNTDLSSSSSSAQASSPNAQAATTSALVRGQTPAGAGSSRNANARAISTGASKKATSGASKGEEAPLSSSGVAGKKGASISGSGTKSGGSSTSKGKSSGPYLSAAKSKNGISDGGAQDTVTTNYGEGQTVSVANLTTEGRPATTGATVSGTAEEAVLLSASTVLDGCDSFDPLDNLFLSNILTKSLTGDGSSSTPSALKFAISMLERLESELLSQTCTPWQPLTHLYETLLLILNKIDAPGSDSFAALSCLQHAKACEIYNHSRLNPVCNIESKSWQAQSSAANRSVLFSDRFSLPAGGYRAVSNRLSCLQLSKPVSLVVLQNSACGRDKLFFGYGSLLTVSSTGANEEQISREQWQFYVGMVDYCANNFEGAFEQAFATIANVAKAPLDLNQLLSQSQQSGNGAAGMATPSADIAASGVASVNATQQPAKPSKRKTNTVAATGLGNAASSLASAADAKSNSSATTSAAEGAVDNADLQRDNLELNFPKLGVVLADHTTWSIWPRVEKLLTARLGQQLPHKVRDLSVILFTCRIASVSSFGGSCELLPEVSNPAAAQMSQKKKTSSPVHANTNFIEPIAKCFGAGCPFDGVDFRKVPCSFDSFFQTYHMRCPELKKGLQSNCVQYNTLVTKAAVNGTGSFYPKGWLLVSSQKEAERNPSAIWYRPTSFLIICEDVKTVAKSENFRLNDEDLPTAFNYDLYVRFLHLSMLGVDSLLLLASYDVDSLLKLLEHLKSQNTPLFELLSDQSCSTLKKGCFGFLGYPFISFQDYGSGASQ